MHFLRRVPITVLLLLSLTPLPALAAESLFNSGAAWQEQFSRLGGEAKVMVCAPVESYPLASASVAGALALGFALDREIRSDLKNVHGRTLDRAADAGTFAGDPYLHLGLAAVLYTAGAVAEAPRFQEVGSKIGEALVLADLSGALLKEAVGRGRPETGVRNDRFSPFSFAERYQSLPSMHTASSFALAHVLSRESDSLTVRILCYTAAGFVGFSRLYQDKHWASDVVLGAALGELAGSAVTNYRARKVTLTPMVSGTTPGLALAGRF